MSSEAEHKFKSLRVLSPAVSWLVAGAAMGKAFLEFTRDNDWVDDIVHPAVSLPIGLAALVCVYASVGTTALFFYRAFGNINAFARARVLEPSTAWLTVVPFANFFAMPYVWTQAYFYSLVSWPSQSVSYERAAVTALSTFCLLVLGVGAGLIGNRSTLLSNGYYPLNVWAVGALSSAGAAMLFSHMVERIGAAQQVGAEKLGWIEKSGKESLEAGAFDTLKLVGLALCVLGIVVTLVLPRPVSALLTEMLPSESPVSQRDALEAAVAEVNSTVPQRLDQITKLTRATVEGTDFVYWYTLRTDAEHAASMMDHVRLRAQPAYCNGDLKFLRELGSAVVFRYEATTGARLGQVRLDKSAC